LSKRLAIARNDQPLEVVERQRREAREREPGLERERDDLEADVDGRDLGRVHDARGYSSAELPRRSVWQTVATL
jgi:hypothetical protein